MIAMYTCGAVIYKEYRSPLEYESLRREDALLLFMGL